MKNILETIKTSEISAEFQEAYDLHLGVIAGIEKAASAMVELAANLKRMRDKKMYLNLGIQSFEEYVEEYAGLKKSQAYTYIQVYERLGITEMSKIGQYGITKAKLLSDISSFEREEFVEKVDVANISVRELKELVDEKNRLEEQCSLFEGQANDLLEQVNQLNDENNELKKRPVEVISQVPQEEINKIQSAAEKEIKKEYKKKEKELKDKLNSEIQAAVDKAKDEQSKSIKDLELKLSEAQASLSDMQHSAKVLSDENIVKFGAIIEIAKNDIENLLKLLPLIKNKDAEKGEFLKNKTIEFAKMIISAAEKV